MTPEQVQEMMGSLLRERDEMNEALASWRDLDSGEGADVISTEIKGRVEHLRGMMRNAAHLIDAIDDVVKMYPPNMSPELDAQRAAMLGDRGEMLAMWSSLAGIAEGLNESLMKLSGHRSEG